MELVQLFRSCLIFSINALVAKTILIDCIHLGLFKKPKALYNACMCVCVVGGTTTHYCSHTQPGWLYWVPSKP